MSYHALSKHTQIIESLHKNTQGNIPNYSIHIVIFSSLFCHSIHNKAMCAKYCELLQQNKIIITNILLKCHLN